MADEEDELTDPENELDFGDELDLDIYEEDGAGNDLDDFGFGSKSNEIE